MMSLFSLLKDNFLVQDLDFVNVTVVLALGIRQSMPIIAKEKMRVLYK